MDERLEGLMKDKKSSAYGRFGDDLAFSGKRRTVRKMRLARKIIGQNGFTVNERKWDEGGVRYSSQRQDICGVTVNDGIAVTEQTLKKFEQVISGCLELGPQSQLLPNETIVHAYRRIEGYVNYVRGIDPVCGAELRKQFRRIAWT